MHYGRSITAILPVVVILFAACGGDDAPTGPDSNKLIRILADRTSPAGTHQYIWDLTDQEGAAVPAGTYRAMVRLAGEIAEDVFAVVNAVPSPGSRAAAPDTTGPIGTNPAALSIEATPDPVATGSTLWIDCDLPRAGDVLVWIEEE